MTPRAMTHPPHGRFRFSHGTLAPVILIFSACGGSSSSTGHDCGAGTHLVGNECVADSPNTGGAGFPSAGGSAGALQTGGTEAIGSTGGTAGEIGSTAGTGGAQTTEPSGAIGILGQPCAVPGALACAGNHQKLTVVCGRSGQWEANQTCGSDQFCDSAPGPNEGLCAAVAPPCASANPGDVVCDGPRSLRCGPDAITTELVDSCSEDCDRSLCDPCPTGDFINCDPECGELDSRCPQEACTANEWPTLDLSELTGSVTVRVPGVAVNACDCDVGLGYVATFRIVAPGTSLLAVYPGARLAKPGCADDLGECTVGAYPHGADHWVVALPKESSGRNTLVVTGEGLSCGDVT